MKALRKDIKTLKYAYDSPNPSWEVCTLYAWQILSAKDSPNNYDIGLIALSRANAILLNFSLNCHRIDPIDPEIFSIFLTTQATYTHSILSETPTTQICRKLNYSDAKRLLNLCKILRALSYMDCSLFILENMLGSKAFNDDKGILPSIYNEIGLCFFEKNQLAECLEVLASSLEIDPMNPETHNVLSNIYSISDQGHDSLLHRSVANKILGENSSTAASIGLDFWAASRKGSLEEREKLSFLFIELMKNDVTNFGAQVPFTTLIATDDPSLILKANVAYSKAVLAPQSRPSVRHAATLSSNKIKVSYVSPDFRDHPIAYLTADLFKSHCRDKFEILGFALLPPDNSDIGRRVIEGLDYFEDLSQLPTAAIADKINAFNSDIVVDLAGYTRGSRPGLFNRISCPVINYLGYPSTTGGIGHDYILADEIVIPQGYENYYSEKVLRLGCCYQPNSPSRAISYVDRQDIGLPSDTFIFANFNAPQKLNKECLTAWRDIIKKCKGSVLYIFGDGLEGEIHEFFGNDKNRVFFAKVMDNPTHLGRVSLCNAFLDSFPYGAHTTASDALFCGVPVISWSGKGFQSRVAMSIMHYAGVENLNATDRESLINIATDFYNSGLSHKHQELRSRLLDKNQQAHPYNIKYTTTEIEKVFMKVANRV